MGTDGLRKKLVFAAAAAGAVLLVLRIVGGRSGEETEEDGDAIDRVGTGRSEEASGGGSVETGLERVSTADDNGDTGTDGVATDETDDEDDEDTADGKGADGSDGDEVAVEATGGRFDGLDLFDYVAIAGAAFEAAREEYRNRI